MFATTEQNEIIDDLDTYDNNSLENVSPSVLGTVLASVIFDVFSFAARKNSHLRQIQLSTKRLHINLSTFPPQQTTFIKSKQKEPFTLHYYYYYYYYYANPHHDNYR